MMRAVVLVALAAVACGSDGATFGGAPDASIAAGGAGASAGAGRGGDAPHVDASAGVPATGGTGFDASAGRGGDTPEASAGAPATGGAPAATGGVSGSAGEIGNGGTAGASTGGAAGASSEDAGACPGGCSDGASWNEVDPANPDDESCAICPEGSTLSTAPNTMYCDPGCIAPRVSASVNACSPGVYFCPKGCAMHFRCSAQNWCLATGESCE